MSTSIKPHSFKAIVGDGKTNLVQLNVKDELSKAFLHRSDVTMVLDAIKTSTKVDEIVITRGASGELEWKINKRDPKESWVPFWMRQIAQFFKSDAYKDKLATKIDKLSVALINFNQFEKKEVAKAALETAAEQKKQADILHLKGEISTKEDQLPPLEVQTNAAKILVDANNDKLNKTSALIRDLEVNNEKLFANRMLLRELGDSLVSDWFHASAIAALDSEGKRANAEKALGINSGDLISEEGRIGALKQINDSIIQSAAPLQTLQTELIQIKMALAQDSSNHAQVDGNLQALKAEIADLKQQLAILSPEDVEVEDSEVSMAEPEPEAPVESRKLPDFTDEELLFLNNLSPLESQLYMSLSETGNSSIIFADFLLALVKGRMGSIEGGGDSYKLKLTPSQGKIQALGKEASITLPDTLEVNYLKDEDKWEIKGNIEVSYKAKAFLPSIVLNLDMMTIKNDLNTKRVELNLPKETGVIGDKIRERAAPDDDILTIFLSDNFIKWNA